MDRRGFTLVELLAVIIILAIIALIAIPMIMGVIESSRMSSFQSSINGIKEAVEIYVNENPSLVGAGGMRLSYTEIIWEQLDNHGGATNKLYLMPELTKDTNPHNWWTGYEDAEIVLSSNPDVKGIVFVDQEGNAYVAFYSKDYCTYSDGYGNLTTKKLTPTQACSGEDCYNQSTISAANCLNTVICRWRHQIVDLGGSSSNLVDGCKEYIKVK